MDAVVHLVGIISETRAQTFDAVHVGGTKNMLMAAHASSVRRFVHMSALGTRADARSCYHQSKWKAEQAVRNSPLEWTIFRPSIIYGPGDGFVNLFAKISRRSPIVPVMGSGASRFQPVAVQAVAKAFTRACTEPAAVGTTLTLAGPEVLTLSQVIDAIVRVTRRKRLKLHIPLPVARIQAAIAEFIFQFLLGKAPPLNSDQVTMLQEDNTGDGSEADALFGLSHEPFETGIARYLKVR
jgi:NADH dehydrogenase